MNPVLHCNKSGHDSHGIGLRNNELDFEVPLLSEVGLPWLGRSGDPHQNWLSSPSHPTAGLPGYRPSALYSDSRPGLSTQPITGRDWNLGACESKARALITTPTS